MYDELPDLSADEALTAEPELFGLGRYSPNPATTLYGAVCLASSGVSAYHGYKRNQSVGWAIVWGVVGGLFPIITPAVAIAQGFGHPAE